MDEQHQSALLVRIVFKWNQLNSAMLDERNELFQIAQLELVTHRSNEDG